MLEQIKTILNINSSDKDPLLTVLIEQAIDEAVNYTHNEDIATLKGCISNMVVYNYNRLGTQGIDSESYSGVNFSYSADYPESIIRQLNAHRKVRLC